MHLARAREPAGAHAGRGWQVPVAHARPVGVHKVAAMLLCPQRRPWKVLAAAEFERALPGVGVAALVTALTPRQRLAARLPPRLAAHWEALAAVQPRRLLEPAEMTQQQVGLEPLAGNARVARAAGGGTALTWTQAVGR